MQKLLQQPQSAYDAMWAACSKRPKGPGQFSTLSLPLKVELWQACQLVGLLTIQRLSPGQVCHTCATLSLFLHSAAP